MGTDPLVQALVQDAEALRAAGVAEGQQQAIRAYFGQSAIRLTVGLFASALHEAAAQMAAIDADAAQFFGQQAALFAEFANPPQIVSVSPAADAANVQLHDQIVLGFSSPLDPATITADNFYVAPTSGGQHLTADVHYDGEKTVTIIPSNGFSAGVAYTVTATKAVRSKLGQSMGTDWTTHFTAAAA